MPNKFLNRKGIAIKKQKYKVTNWSEYNESLKRRGDRNYKYFVTCYAAFAESVQPTVSPDHKLTLILLPK